MSIIRFLPYNISSAIVYSLVGLIGVVMLAQDYWKPGSGIFGSVVANAYEIPQQEVITLAAPSYEVFESVRIQSSRRPNNLTEALDGFDLINVEELKRVPNVAASLVGQRSSLDEREPKPKKAIGEEVERLNGTDSNLLSKRTGLLHYHDESEQELVRARRGNQMKEVKDLDPLMTAAGSKIEHNNECALILKRTYILKKNNEDEWGEKFVFNDEDEKKKVHKKDLCIKYADINKAVEEAKHKIKFKKPEDLGTTFELSEQSIGNLAELNLATAQLIIKKFDLSHDEILNALPMIDMSSTKFSVLGLCPRHVRPMLCMKSRYRTITAHCNNLRHPSWGATNTPYSRYLPPDYADGLDLPRAAQDGSPLPSARLITSIVHRDADEPSNDYSALFPSWGQVLNHDVTRAAVGEGK